MTALSIARAEIARLSVDNSGADPKRGFSSFGEYALAVANASVLSINNMPRDPRLLPLAAAPSTSANEASGADGGLLVPPEFAKDIFVLSQSLDEESFLPYCDPMELKGNNMLLPKDETTPWGTNGVRARWQSEGQVATPSKPKFGGMDLRMKKLTALVPVSNELLEDGGTAMGPYLTDKTATAMNWSINSSILYGTGVGMPLGAVSAGATVVVAKDSGQAAYTLSTLNLANMLSRLLPGSLKRSIWIVSPEVMPALLTLTLGNFPVWVPMGPSGAITGAPFGTLFGRPVFFSQQAKGFSAQGDVMLLDLRYYQTIVKAGGVQTATSMHLYFDADAMAFRTTFRMDGAPKLTAPVTSNSGTSQLAPIVMLAAR